MLKGKVVSINKKYVVIDIGFKSDGLVNRTEFKDQPELNNGDEVEVYIVETEDDLGQLGLSREEKHLAETAWQVVTSAQETGAIVRGYVKSRTKGGLVVDVNGSRRFLTRFTNRRKTN